MTASSEHPLNTCRCVLLKRLPEPYPKSRISISSARNWVRDAELMRLTAELLESIRAYKVELTEHLADRDEILDDPDGSERVDLAPVLESRTGAEIVSTPSLEKNVVAVLGSARSLLIDRVQSFRR